MRLVIKVTGYWTGLQNPVGIGSFSSQHIVNAFVYLEAICGEKVSLDIKLANISSEELESTSLQ